MSATVSAIPFLLIYAAGASIINFANYAKHSLSTFDGERIHLDKADIEKMLSSDIETTIMDKDILLKTLEEYGASNIEIDNENIYCDCDEFHIEFYKEPLKPYMMSITYKDKEKMEELASNLSSEYGINAQEVSYNKIKERLEAQNLEIEQEDIYDDNTIVLTVNLE